ncbi:Os08g0468901, partial [Oryza sativa Japonica Group]
SILHDVARRRHERQEAIRDVVQNVHVLLLVVADDGGVAGADHRQAQEPGGAVDQHVVLRRHGHVGAAVEVELHVRDRHGHARRRRPREARLQADLGVVRRRQRPEDGHQLAAHGVVRVLLEPGERRAGVDEDAARAVVVDGEHQRVDGQPLLAEADALEGHEVEGRQRRVDDQRRGLHRRAGGACVGAVERREHAEVEPARLRREERREAVGEPRRAELAHQRQRPAAEADHAGAVGELARVDVAAAERDVGHHDLARVGRAEREGLAGEDAGGGRLVAVVVLVHAH